jgi:DNA-binding response OmpR family regulator
MSLNILWIDDEVDMLKPYSIFFEKKGFSTYFFNNVEDALSQILSLNIDIILLDENMPGTNGLEALPKIKELIPDIPIIMITKSEEENLMEEAIGKHIADYLIKPVNPNQVLLSIKKIINKNALVNNQAILDYQREFRNLSMEISCANSFKDWEDIYKKLTQWELRLEYISDSSMLEILINQKNEANQQFGEFIEDNYLDLLEKKEGNPVFSHQAFQKYVNPLLQKDEKVLVLMIDNMRYDQWLTIKPLFTEYYSIVQEDLYMSILPTVTQYARNAFFAGLSPLDIQKKFPDKWFNDFDEENKNTYEREFIEEHLKSLKKEFLSTYYFKILNSSFEQKVLDSFNNFKNNNLITIVYNFIDILSHAKTDNQIVDEFIRDDKTFRSITKTWFENAPLLKIIETAAKNKMKLVITTDHGTIYVKRNIPIIGDRESSTNIRYKTGKNLNYNSKNLFSINTPEKYLLPRSNVSSKYVFAKEDYFFTYPKNQNHFVNYYKDTYQHGGISLEEMFIPITILNPK